MRFSFLVLFFLLPRVLFAEAIQDDGKFFSDEVKKTLSSTIAEIAGKTSPSQRIFVVTKDKVDSVEEQIKRSAPAASAEGVYVFISRQPKKLILIPSKGFKQRVSKSQLDQVRTGMLQHFREEHYDQGLKFGVEQLTPFLLSKAPVAKTPSHQADTFAPSSAPSHEESSGFSLQKILFVFALFLAGIGIVRLLANLGRPRAPLPPSNMSGNNWGGGYQGGSQPGGYPPPSGSGGFFQNMFGGIAGAVAGNWMYDKLFGNHHAQAQDQDRFASHQKGEPESTYGDDQGSQGWDYNANSGDYSSNDDWSGGSDSSSGDSDW
jgi:uncharacterized protein